jgi:hypothetical protein
MAKFICALVLIVGCAQAQVAANDRSGDAGPQHAPAVADSSSAARKPESTVGLVRGVLVRLDPIHDQLLIRAFGGGDVRIAFDPRTQLLSDNTQTRLTGIPPGSVVSVDTVIDGGKLFARSVRTGASSLAELNGQVVRYDASQSQLTLRDPVSSKENVSLRISPGTVIVSGGQPASPQSLSSGTLVRVWFSSPQKAASKVEILAEPGKSFSFQGRVVGVDLRARVLVLSNDSDQSVRELSIGWLDNAALNLLREGADVSIDAKFDGERYNVRSVALVTPNP